MNTTGMRRVPRTGWLLLVVLVVAAGLLWRIRSGRPDAEFVTGGPLFRSEPGQVAGFVLTRAGAQYRFDRIDSGEWTLTGGLTDFVDRAAMEKFLGELLAGRGGPLLPGTEPEDRRYEFNGNRAVRLTLFAEDGGQERLALGAVNPVTGLIYASGAGRPACFPVSREIRELLVELPDGVRTGTLLPEFRYQDVTRIDVVDGRTDRSLQRLDGRWWLRVEDPELPGIDPVMRRYHALYPDRRRDDGDGRWILADDDAVGQLLYEISSLIVREFIPAAAAALNAEAWQLDPPYRRVILRGDGLNPAPRYGQPDRLSIDFGLSLDGKRVPARRLENVVTCDAEALRSLEMAPDDLVQRNAVAFPVLLADSLRVESDGATVLAGHRDAARFAEILAGKSGDLDRVEGRLAWLQDVPEPPVGTRTGKTTHVRIRSLVVELERVPILAALPPSDAEPDFLPQDRAQLVVTGAGPDGPVEHRVRVGWLDPERLPAGAVPVEGERQSDRPAGLWTPATGQFLQIPGQLLISIRNYGLN